MKNNQSITASAPGKLLLMGDHAVVYGYPSIVTAINERMFATVSLTEEKTFVLNAPNVNVTGYKKSLSDLGAGDVSVGARFVEVAVKNFHAAHPMNCGVTITIRSEFSSQYGFGSSSASTVSILKALSELFDRKLDNRQLFDLAYKTVLDIQGVGSGFDVAAAIWGGTLYFTGGGRVIEPMEIGEIPLIVGYTGIKADTKTLIGTVAKLKEQYPEKVARIFQAIQKLVDEGKVRIEDGDWQRTGTLMNFNQDYLRDLGVSSEKLESLISAAKGAGAYGAKLSGAGGGDCMIALHPDGVKGKLVVEKAITAVGGTVLTVSPNAEGVRVETTDDQKELFIVVDKNDEIVGYKTRYECHHDKTLIHRTVGALIFNDKGELLLQKRSMTKDMEAGLWGISAAGHVTKGQTDEAAVHRELQEEVGVDMPLTFVKKFITSNEFETERAALFRGLCNGPFTPDAQEVADLTFFAPREIALFVASKKLILTSAAAQALKEVGVL